MCCTYKIAQACCTETVTAPHTVWHSFFTNWLVTGILPSSIMMYNGTCGIIKDVHLDPASITVLSSCRRGAIPMTISLNASDAHSRAIRDLTGYMDVIAEVAIPALLVIIFLIVTGDSFCQWWSFLNCRNKRLSSFGAVWGFGLSIDAGLCGICTFAGVGSFAALRATVTQGDLVSWGFEGRAWLWSSTAVIFLGATGLGVLVSQFEV